MAPTSINGDLTSTSTLPDKRKPPSQPSTAIPYTENTTKPSGVLHRSLHVPPLHVSHASGIYIYLTPDDTHKGPARRILDATGGAAVACLGHGNQEVQSAIFAQQSRLSYCHSLFFSTDVSERLATSLLESTDHKMSKVLILNSGSEAMESVLKMSRQYFLELSPPQPSRTHFIARRQSYHGTTLGSLGVGGHVARRKLYEPLLTHNVSFVSPCYAYRDQLPSESDSDYVSRLAAELDAEFVRLGPNTVCAFIAETVSGAALGCVPSVPGYFRAMRDVCTRHGALLVLDEVMSGTGRCGYLHGWQDPDVDVVPDIQTLGKGLGGGYAPVAAMLISPRVTSVLDHGTGAFQHGQTYQGHPICCAAALAVQIIIRGPDMMPRVRNLGARLASGLRAGLSQHPHVGDIRGRGLFWGIEFVADQKTKEPFPPERLLAMGVHELGLRDPWAISLYPGTGSDDGVRGDHVLVAPAYTCTDQEVDLIVQKTVGVVREFFRLLFEVPKRSEGGEDLRMGGSVTTSTTGQEMNGDAVHDMNGDTTVINDLLDEGAAELCRPADGTLLPTG